MTRFAFACLVLCACGSQSFGQRPENIANRPGVAPKVVEATATENGGRVTLLMSVTKIVPVEEGNSTVYKPVFETRVTEVTGDIKAFNREGKEIEPKELLALLKKPTAIAVTQDGKLNDVFKAMFRDDVAVVAMPGMLSDSPGQTNVSPRQARVPKNSPDRPATPDR